ncbi:MAG: CARDB domain-containing protein [Promethearchaeota archaeon]
MTITITNSVKVIRKKSINYRRIILSFTLSFLFIFSINNGNSSESHSSIDSSKSQPLTSNIIGEDDRVRVSPTTSYPWSAIVKLQATWGTDVYISSGTMIDENHVLTAGHCVYSHSRGGWADSVKVIPGADNGIEPFGHAWSLNIRCYNSWISSARTIHDFAVITLDRDIGLQTGWMELYTTLSSSSTYTGILNTAGYPADLGYGENMYWTSDIGYAADEYTHWHYLDAFGGQSGSPIWNYNGINRKIISVFTNSIVGLDLNYGTRINRNKLDCIMNWLTADETSTDKPDLTSQSNEFAGFTPALGGAGLTNFEVWCKIRNVGTTNPNTFTVSYYASPDTTFSTADYLIGTDVIASLSPTEAADSQWIGVLPNTIPSGEYYIGWILDANDNIDEFNENNNWKFIWDYKLRIDADPPTNPLSCIQLIGSTTSNVWQGSVNNPSFSWSSGSDSDTGIAGYYYYWGTNPDGISSSFTTSSNLEAKSVNTGTYYLRVKAKDKIGNNASWTTLYVFKYDGIAPINPLTCDQRAGSTESDLWQGEVDDPFFIWDDGSDSHTGVAGYYYYWGPHPFGTSTSFTESNIFNPPAVEPGVYYLRVSTKDNTGNTAPWTTLYVFKYQGNSINNDDEPIEDSDVLTFVILYGLPIMTGILGVICIYKVRERWRK